MRLRSPMPSATQVSFRGVDRRVRRRGSRSVSHMQPAWSCATCSARASVYRLHASVKATTGPGEYKQVSAIIPGTEPNLPEIWIKGHDNYRNTGGANNLTGVGATMEVARVLSSLVKHGALQKPRRTIRFLWSAEHYGSIYQFYKHPERLGRALLLLNVDMVGYHQERAKAVFRLYRTPYPRPHFVNDVTEEFMRSIGEANTISIRNRGMESPGFYDGFFAPTGSRDQLHYAVEDFWGPERPRRCARRGDRTSVRPLQRLAGYSPRYAYGPWMWSTRRRCAARS